MKLSPLLLLTVLLLSDVVLEKRTLLNGKIEMLIPKEFKVMESDVLKIKYTGNMKPELVLTNENATTTIALTFIAARADSSLIQPYTENIMQTYKKGYPTATWHKNGVRSINGKKVGYIILSHDAQDKTKVFDYLFLTDVDGKLLVGSFNCEEKERTKWESVGEQIVTSLKVN
jgi:hypothetical protein